MDRPTQGLRAAIVCGGLVILIAIVMNLFYPLSLDTLPNGFVTPILALEFTMSLSDAKAIFNDDRTLMKQVQTGHWVDMVFLLAYGAFLALPNWVMWLRFRHWSGLAGMMAACVAPIADVLENNKLLQLGNALLGDGPPPDFALLRLFVGIKFLAISIAMLCLGRNLFRFGITGKLFAVLSLALVPVTMLALEGNPAMIEIMGLLTAIGWLVLMVWLVMVRKGLPPLSSQA